MLDDGAFGMSCVAGVVFVRCAMSLWSFFMGVTPSWFFSKSHEIAYLLAV